MVVIFLVKNNNTRLGELEGKKNNTILPLYNIIVCCNNINNVKVDLI